MAQAISVRDTWLLPNTVNHASDLHSLPVELDGPIRFTVLGLSVTSLVVLWDHSVRAGKEY